jgi:hypothetical protein
MGRKQHQIAFLYPMSFTQCLNDLAMLFTGKYVNVGADQDTAMPEFVFDCQSSSPEIRSNALRRPVPMAVSSQPSKLLGRDLGFGGSCSEVCRVGVFQNAWPHYQDDECQHSAECSNYMRSPKILEFAGISHATCLQYSGAREKWNNGNCFSAVGE